MACARCAADARDEQARDSHIAFSRGLLLGIGAAVVGMMLYAAFTMVTGWSFGYLVLGVGYLIAKAIKKGSHGLGGRRYQVAAVLLTYGAISLAAVPISISFALNHRQAQHNPAAVSPGTAESGGSGESAAPPSGERTSPGALAGRLVLLGLASPFMNLRDPLQGAIWLFILFIGLRIAWQLTAGEPLGVEGPYATAGVG